MGGFVLCGIGAIFLPLLIRLDFGVDEESTPPFWLEARVWGLRVLRFPGRRSPRASVLGRWLLRWVDRILTRSEEPTPSAPAPTAPRRRSPRWSFGFARWAAGRLASLGALLTRRLRIRCGGIDPALLGSLSGVAGIVGGALDLRRFNWIPDFAPSGPRLDVRWDLSISVWKLVRWTGETFVDRKRRPEREPVL